MFFENDNAHLQIKTQLVQLYKTNRVPHALLFSGKEGSGHFQLAMFFAKTLLCKEVISGPCNQCTSCNKIDNFNHPDLHFSLLRCLYIALCRFPPALFESILASLSSTSK